jgi:hypothetical protein
MRALRTRQLGWIPLVLAVALPSSGFAIYRMHGIGSRQTPARQPYLLLGPGLSDRDAAKAAWRFNS